jgi:hypothetical protein
MRDIDQVPCYFAGDLREARLPAEIRPRAELHRLKKAKLGRFVDRGKAFQFNVFKEELPLGLGNVLPFARLKNHGDKLHYETPMAGDRTAYARSHGRNIRVSSRVLFSQPGIQWQNYARLA